MPLECNPKLKKLSDKSALTSSVIPVLICDENLFVCTKSIGAERLLKDIRPRQRITDRFSSDTLETIGSTKKNNFFTTFHSDDSNSSVMVIRGCASGESYIAVIFRPQYVFSGNVPESILNESLDSVSETVTRILSHKTDSQTELNHRCQQLSRICSIYGETVTSSALSIPEFMDSFAAGCEAVIPLLGMSVKCDRDKAVPLTTNVPPELLQITAATMAVSLLSAADSGILELGCTMASSGDHVEISVSAELSSEQFSPVSDFDGLMNLPLPTKLELLALADLVPKMGIRLECFSSDGKLTVSAHIPISNAQSAEMYVYDTAASLLFAELIKDMYEYTDFCGKL